MMWRRLSEALNFAGAGIGFGIGAGLVVACGLVLAVVIDSPEPVTPRPAATSCNTLAA